MSTERRASYSYVASAVHTDRDLSDRLNETTTLAYPEDGILMDIHTGRLVDSRTIVTISKLLNCSVANEQDNLQDPKHIWEISSDRFQLTIAKCEEYGEQFGVGRADVTYFNNATGDDPGVHTVHRLTNISEMLMDPNDPTYVEFVYHNNGMYVSVVIHRSGAVRTLFQPRSTAQRSET